MECIQHIGLLQDKPREDPMYDVMADAAILPALQALQSASIKPAQSRLLHISITIIVNFSNEYVILLHLLNISATDQSTCV